MGRLEEPRWLWRGTVPSLNGLRAVSVAIVLAVHSLHQANVPSHWLPIQGSTGVDVFFVISGFLITLLLLREQRNTGTISLRQFYLRRSLRILPAYFAYLTFAALCCGVSRFSLISAASYTATFWLQDLDWDVMHTWSLCVEEHFYLVWPPVLILLGRRKAFLAAIGCIALTPILRALFHVLFQGRMDLRFFSPTRMDAIAAGCVLAFMATSPRLASRSWLSGIRGRWVCALGIALIVASKIIIENWSHNRAVGYYCAFASGTVNALAIAGIVWACVTGTFSRFLNWRPVAFFGLLSYSLYLWQQPLFDPARTGPLFSMPLNLAIATVAAVCSYYFIERPLLGLRRQSLTHVLALRSELDPGVCPIMLSSPTCSTKPWHPFARTSQGVSP
jgi:peptidoglycan/LPS O-acetylase OafA/YrhL